ncbi:MAG: UbiA family prenyltransferase, partial [Actinomycetes bacterium]
MKLRVVELLLVTTLPALFLASKGVPGLVTTVATLVGGTLAAGASNAFNMVIEVDSDRLMKRTAKRPLATGAVTVKAATIFATVIAVVSLAIFWIWTTPLATYLTLAAI